MFGVVAHYGIPGHKAVDLCRSLSRIEPMSGPPSGNNCFGRAFFLRPSRGERPLASLTQEIAWLAIRRRGITYRSGTTDASVTAVMKRKLDVDKTNFPATRWSTTETTVRYSNSFCLNFSHPEAMAFRKFSVTWAHFGIYVFAVCVCMYAVADPGGLSGHDHPFVLAIEFVPHLAEEKTIVKDETGVKKK